MASSTTHANLLQYGRSNHLLVPTNLLQEQAEASGLGAAGFPDWVADAFTGGLVRVESANATGMRSGNMFHICTDPDSAWHCHKTSGNQNKLAAHTRAFRGGPMGEDGLLMEGG